jgi:hypothetical protein
MPSEEVPADTADPALAAVVAAEPPAWDQEAVVAVAAVAVAVVAVGGAGSRLGLRIRTARSFE